MEATVRPFLKDKTEAGGGCNFYKRTLRQEREFYGKRAGQMNRKTYISIRYKSLKIIIFNNYLYKRKERETGEEIIFKLT